MIILMMTTTTMMTMMMMMMMMMTMVWWPGWAIYNTLVGAAEGWRPTSGARLSFMATHGEEIHGQGNSDGAGHANDETCNMYVCRVNLYV